MWVIEYPSNKSPQNTHLYLLYLLLAQKYIDDTKSHLYRSITHNLLYSHYIRLVTLEKYGLGNIYTLPHRDDCQWHEGCYDQSWQFVEAFRLDPTHSLRFIVVYSHYIRLASLDEYGLGNIYTLPHRDLQRLTASLCNHLMTKITVKMKRCAHCLL